VHGASFYGDRKVLRYLLDAGVGVSARTTAGLTALDLAVTQGHHDCVMLLVCRGALTVENPVAQTSLQLARRSGHNEIVEFFQHDEAAMTVIAYELGCLFWCVTSSCVCVCVCVCVKAQAELFVQSAEGRDASSSGSQTSLESSQLTPSPA